jgi:hypothetical protein
MKTKNQTGQVPLELADSKAANEDGFTPPTSTVRETNTSATGRNLAWSPKEVWRTRVKTERQQRNDRAPR